jgi:hypothetical protein
MIAADGRPGVTEEQMSSSQRAAARHLPILIGVVAGLFLFALIFGPGLPLAGAPFWTMPKSDMIGMTAGYEAFLREPWTFPPTLTSRLTGQPISIVYTDSIPWLALMLKGLGVGGLFNPLGLFMLLSYLLQPVAMVALLRAMGVTRPWPLVAGALLALMMPTWTTRQFGHIALSGHWLLLFALALSVASARNGLTTARIGGFALVAALATGVHAYHLPPIGAAFGAALISVLLQGGLRTVPRVAAAALVVLAAVAISAWILGYGQGLGPSGGADALGAYSMNVLGPVYPQGSLLFGETWTGEWFKHPVSNNNQAFEGFQYMGVAPLLLALAAAGLALRRTAAHPQDAGRSILRFAPLALAMLLLTAAAIGPVIYLGDDLVAKLPKPSGKLAEVIGLFRAHGRFFWMPGYLVLAVGVASAARLPRRVAAVVLAAAVILQAVETWPLRQGVHAVFVRPDTHTYPAALDDAPALRGRPWTFTPTYFCSADLKDLRMMAQLNRLAIRTGGTSNSFLTARSTEGACKSPAPDLLVTAGSGDRRIVVALGGQGDAKQALAAFAGRTDCYQLERGLLCGAGLDAIVGLSPAGR